MAKTNKKETNNFLNCFKKFIKHANGLQKAISVSMLIATSLHKKEIEKVKDFIDKNGKDLKITKNGARKFKLDIQHSAIFKKLNNEEEKSEAATKLIPRSIFIALISQFDLLVADMMNSVLIKYPEIISKDKNLTFEQALKIGTPDAIRQHFINEEIDDVLHGNHIGHVDWFENKIKIKIKKSLSDQWFRFIELTERRNLFVHNDGIINNIYLSNCKNSGVEINKDIKVGDTLNISPKYFEESRLCLYELAIKLSWLVWRKMEPKDIEEIDIFFHSEIGVELINETEYKLAENIFSFMLDNCEGSSDLLKNIFLINLALSNKLKGDLNEVEKILNKKDWSASRIELRFAVHVLRKEFKEALILMEKIGVNSDLILRENYEIDPIYKEFRQTKDFKRIFKKIYGEEYISIKEDSGNFEVKSKKKLKNKNKK